MKAGLGFSSTRVLSDLDVAIEPDAPIGAMTWYGIGGRADLLVRPRTVEALRTLVQRAHRSGSALRVMGSGANLLVADEGVRGIVVKLDEAVFREIKFSPEGEIDRVLAMAGADVSKTLMDFARRGLWGLEMMAGIPASFGGAIRMNAGGKFGSIGDAVESVTCIDHHGELVTHNAKEIAFGYRETNVAEPIVLATMLRVEPGDPITLRDRVKEIFAFKKASQPLADHSAGCAFKNPIDPETEERVSAGKLIDEAGLKGHAVGGASVSDRHANFIVTKPGAMASDVLQLLREIKRRVYESSGIRLHEEICVWGAGEEDEDGGRDDGDAMEGGQ